MAEIRNHKMILEIKTEVSKMGNNLKVLLTGEGSEFGKNCANILRTYGCDVILLPKDGNVLLSKIESTRADVAVMDAFMSNLDALGVINKLKEKNAVTGECLEQLEEWQQISEVEYQLTWLDNFKAKYLKK